MLKDSKANKILMLVILIALAIRGGGGMLQNKLNSKEDQHIPFSDGTDIIINAKEAAVTLLTDTDEEDLVVTYKGGDKAAFSHNDKQVSITVGKHSVWGGRNGSLYVSIPSKRTIGSLTIKTESGAIELPALSLQGDFEASSTSGRINLANITAGGHIRLSTTSGTINAANLADGEKAEIESVSGRISLDSYQGKDMYLHTISGSIMGSSDMTKGSIRIHSVSGGIDFDLVQDIPDYSLSMETLSGQTDLAPARQGAGSVKVELKSISGRTKFGVK